GISSASHSSSSGGGSSSAAPPVVVSSPCDTTYYRDTGEPYDGGGGASSLDGPPPHYTRDRAPLELYAGGQKVPDSDGSWQIEASVTDFRLRVRLAIARYYETLSSGDKLTMTMPQLTLGWRIDDFGPTAVFLEAGGTNVSTKGDPMA